ncbi:MAG: DUF1598 domain-containing protein [Planctomycetota bacterium]|nr:DUF1598 domain-containing protein [Planctomycetota bacterium]
MPRLARKTIGIACLFAATLTLLAVTPNNELPGQERKASKAVPSQSVSNAKTKTSGRAALPRPEDILRQERGLNRVNNVGDNGDDASQLLDEQLAAGEFGPAWETARAATDPAERKAMFKKVTEAQFQAGNFRGAFASLRQINQSEERRDVVEEQLEQLPTLTGGSMANFQPLMQLIQQETSGLWEETGDGEGTMSQYQTGVIVDPNGLLRMLTRAEDKSELANLAHKARAADLNADLNTNSPLRMVSLTRLEREISQRMSEGQPAVATMLHLAGLTEVKYIFVYPEEQEIVIAGPAEGWRYDARGQAVGSESGRPTLYLDDFVTVLRIFAPEGASQFSCSINPREAGLKALKDYVEKSQSRGPISSTAVKSWVNQLQKKLGMQDIVLEGVPGDSRVARVITEADYRMKLIGIGKLKAPAGIESFFDLLSQADQKSHPDLEALRWWMTMKYDAVLHSADRNVFAIEGSSVLCLSENEFLNAQGQRVHTGKAEATNRLFAEKFTAHYDALAKQDLVFADLQNVFDLSLVAALVHQQGLLDRTGWDMGAFGPHGEYSPARYEVPMEVESVVNHRVYGGKDIVVQVAGGVRADLVSVVRNDELVQESPRLGKMAKSAQAPTLPAGRWWWDVREE